MPFTINNFIERRPVLFHLTARANLDGIFSSLPSLQPASLLLKASKRHAEVARTPRREHLHVVVQGKPVMLRDQAPLYEGNMLIDAGSAFEDIVELLNDRVFFWPGTAKGPIPPGLRHFARYRHEECAVLAVPAGSLFTANPDATPLFSRYNSGSPRCHPKAGKSPRGTRTFLAAQEFERNPCDVAEVTFAGAVRLPHDTRVVGHRVFLPPE